MNITVPESDSAYRYPIPRSPFPVPRMHPEYVYNRTSACCPAGTEKKKKAQTLFVVVPLMRHVAHAYFSTLSERFGLREISIGIPVMVSVSPGGLWA